MNTIERDASHSLKT